jgi:hypothetical protein
VKFSSQREASQWETLLSWAVAEARNDKSGLAQMPLVQSLYPKVEARADLSSEEETRLVGSLLIARSPLLAFFMRAPTTWYFGSVTVPSLRELHTIQTFSSYAPKTRKMEELALEPAEDPALRIADFDLSRMVGSPIAVADDLKKTWCLLDGYKRCTEIIKLHEQGEVGAKKIDMFVGVAPKTSKSWRHW